MKSVVICGSRRYEKGIRALAVDLKKMGVTVYEPWLHQAGDEWDTLSDAYKDFTLMGLTHDHLHKIRLADIVYVYNQDGYAGPSTTLEIGAATMANKPIYSLEPDLEERSRNILFQRQHPRNAIELMAFL